MKLLIILFLAAGVTGCQLPSNSTHENLLATNCGFADGPHDATVNYYNPQTGHIAKYDLKVQVKDCQVVQINFPNGGWLNEDHLKASTIDENNEATLTDDTGRKWKIRLR